MNKKYNLFFLLFAIAQCSFSQARLVLNNNPYIVLNGGSGGSPIHIVLDNGNANAITLATAQTDGGIKSEGEYNIVKWNIGTNTGTYTIPLTQTASTTAGADGIPLVIDITSAGTGAGNIKVSTVSTGDDNTPYPSFINNLSSTDADKLGTGGNDNSYRVMDRFWIVDANGYNASASPAGTMTFNYVDAERSAGSNSINAANLQAQRYRAATNDWENYAPTGTQAAGSFQGQVSAITFTAADFERGWVLVDRSAPLPIELIEFTGDCANGQRNLYWTTASETNNNYFTIEKSVDGKEFIEIGTTTSLAPGGYSTSKLTYNYIDKNNIPGNYYRLKQTDYDGKFEYSKIIYNNCEDIIENPSSTDVFPNPSNGVVNVLLTGYENQEIQINVMNAVGQIVAERKVIGDGITSKETFDLTGHAKGIYYVSVITPKDKTTHKVINQY